MHLEQSLRTLKGAKRAPFPVCEARLNRRFVRRWLSACIHGRPAYRLSRVHTDRYEARG